MAKLHLSKYLLLVPVVAGASLVLAGSNSNQLKPVSAIGQSALQTLTTPTPTPSSTPKSTSQPVTNSPESPQTQAVTEGAAVGPGEPQVSNNPTPSVTPSPTVTPAPKAVCFTTGNSTTCNSNQTQL